MYKWRYPVHITIRGWPNYCSGTKFRKLQKSCESWGLTINIKKTKYMIIRDKGRDLDVENDKIKTWSCTWKLLFLQTERVYKTIVESICNYRAETWERKKKVRDRLMALKIDFWRRSCHISRLRPCEKLDHKTNYECKKKYCRHRRYQKINVVRAPPRNGSKKMAKKVEQ